MWLHKHVIRGCTWARYCAKWDVKIPETVLSFLIQTPVRLCLTAVCPWTCNSTSLCLSFLICKMRMLAPSWQLYLKHLKQCSEGSKPVVSVSHYYIFLLDPFNIQEEGAITISISQVRKRVHRPSASFQGYSSNKRQTQDPKQVCLGPNPMLLFTAQNNADASQELIVL